MRKFVFGLLASGLIASQSFAANVVTYSSNDYLDNQYSIIKMTFDNLEVVKVNAHDIKITIPTDYGFVTGHAELKRSMKDTLRKFSHFLTTYPESTLLITGHTDNRGGLEYNKQLGMKRAKAVEEILLESVNPFRLSTASEGEEVPKCSNKTQSGMECNRRVEMLLTMENNLEF